MVIKIENGKMKLMIKRGTAISPNSHFTIPIWDRNHNRTEIDKRALLYNGKGCFDYAQNGTHHVINGSFTVHYWVTSNPEYDVVEIPVIVKDKGYVSIHKNTGCILIQSDKGGALNCQRLYLSDNILIPWDYEPCEIPMPEITSAKRKEPQTVVIKPEAAEKEPVKFGKVNLRQLKFSADEFSEKEKEFADYLRLVRGYNENEVRFIGSVIHFVITKNVSPDVIIYVDPDVFLSRELEGYMTIKPDARRRYRRCFKLFGEFNLGRLNKSDEDKQIMEKYARFVQNQQDKHYSAETILKTCQVVDRIKIENGYCDKDILNTESDKLCEKITGRQYRYNLDSFLNNIIRKYQTYLQECEA